MHGRVKVRTSEEVQAIKNKEEQEKAAVYESKMKEILSKKKNGRYDDEIMSLTSDVIYMNPDVLTVWNTRKERLLELKLDGTGVTQEQIDGELKLTEVGLRINPKSYCAWYHRCWVLDNFADESAWARELKLCSKYLELDDRNFHCWDYRRYVVERHSVKIEEELDYSMQKLASNFSNYSAWHYRSKLIPRVHQMSNQENLFDNEIYQTEISLVENAVYTDPADQSAWFYHRWLLGQITSQSRFVQAGYCEKAAKAWVVVYPQQCSNLVEGLDDQPWEYLDGNKYSNILVKQIDKGFSGDITLYKDDAIIDSITLDSSDNSAKPAKFNPVLNEKEGKSLRDQLESYQQLLELEPDNKWTLLAVVIIKEKLGDEVKSSLLEKLSSIDTYRRTYYSNIICRHTLEKALSKITNWHASFVFRNQNLNAFHHSYYFTLFQEVDFSGNSLGDDVIPKLSALLSCKVLILANCKITLVDAFPYLPNLRSLNLSENEIPFHSVPSGLLRCRSLEFIDLTGTKVTSEESQIVANQLPNLKIKF